jgi:hypothetical protein
MKQFIYIAVFTWAYALAGCGIKDVSNKSNGTPVTAGNTDTSIFNGGDSFNVDAIEFVSRKVLTDSAAFNKHHVDKGCVIGYLPLKKDELAEEYKLFDNQILYYYYKGDIRKLLKDSVFVTKFFKKALDVDPVFYEIEHLRFLKMDTVSVLNDGNNIIAFFSYETPTSSNQDRPTIMINPDKHEITIYSFSGFKVKGNMLELDFKVRGGKHTLYMAGYNDSLGKYIPKCYKIITTIMDED